MAFFYLWGRPAGDTSKKVFFSKKASREWKCLCDKFKLLHIFV